MEWWALELEGLGWKTGNPEIDDVLRTTPRVDLLGYSADSQHPTSNSIGMRGLGGGAQGISRALVMIDGVPLNDPFFGSIQWNRVPLDNIDRVEVVRGGGSPLWGNYAEGGVINIVTRTATLNELEADVRGGSYATYRTSVFGTYRLDDRNTLQGFVAANGTGGYQQGSSNPSRPSPIWSSHHDLEIAHGRL